MKFSPREYILAGLTGVIILFGVTAMLAIPKMREIGRMRLDRVGQADKLSKMERTVEMRQSWEKRLAALQARLNQYPPGKDVTADILIRLENMASTRALRMLRRDVEREAVHGDLSELAVNCRWEGNLQSIVAFLFDLQGEGVMMDAYQISIAPNEKRVLRGSMTINAAYCRQATPKSAGGDANTAGEAKR
jgi:hypothetical protein